jgi:hypothetical protein
MKRLTFSGGGMTLSTNRTLWPLKGGAIAIQPGWFQGHATAFFYINMGFGTGAPDGGPLNMSFPMVPVFQITGPNKNPYPGTFCLPQVPLPANTTVNVGDNATIQIVETAIHGAALFNVSQEKSKGIMIDADFLSVSISHLPSQRMSPMLIAPIASTHQTLVSTTSLAYRRQPPGLRNRPRWLSCHSSLLFFIP